LQEAKSALDASRQKVTTAQQAYLDAQNSYNQAKADAEAGSAELSAAQKKVEDAQTALDEAKQNQERLNSTLAAAQQELTELENQISEASSELERADLEKRIVQAQYQVAVAQEELTAANADVAAKQSDLDAANARVTELEAILNEKQTAVNETNTLYLQAQDAYNTANTEKDAAVQQQTEMETAYNNAVTLKNNATQLQEDAETALTAAQTQVSSAQAAYNAAKTALQDAQAAYDTAKAAASSVSEQIAKGSSGFFEENGSTSALQVFQDEAYSQYTHMGEAKDATSLENMKSTLDYIKKCNDLRKLNGRSELLITDYMMAVAQYDTNASAYTMNHLAHFAVGENLAWGYTTPDSVFGGWYDQEKEQYEKDGNAAAAGHYFNIINAGYKVTGFALNQYGSYGRTFGQTFSSGTSQGGYTLKEYTAKFMAYYNRLMEAPTLEEAAKAKLDEAKETLEQARLVLDTAQANERAASEQLDQRKQETADATAAETAAKNNLDAAKASVTEKTAQVQTAEEAMTTAQTNWENAKAEVSQASDQLNDAREALSGPSASLQEAQQNAAAKETAFNSAKENYYTLGGTVTEFPSKDQAQESYTAAQTRYNEKLAAKEALEQQKTAKETEIAGINTEIENAASVVAQKSSDLTTAQEERNTIEASISENLTTLRQTMEQKAAEYTTSQEEEQAASTACDQAQNAYNAEISNKEQLDADKTTAEQLVQDSLAAATAAAAAKDTAQADYDQAKADYNVLVDARKALEDAQAEESTAKEAYDTAQAALDTATTDLQNAQNALLAATDLSQRAGNLSYEDTLENEITDTDFTYLNASVEKVRELKAAAQNAADAYNTAYQAVLDAEAVLKEAKKENAEAIAQLAIAQAEYDAEAKDTENKDTETKKPEAKKDTTDTTVVKKTDKQSAPAADCRKTASANTTPKTGDSSSPFAFALAGIASVYAGLVSYRKKRKDV